MPENRDQDMLKELKNYVKYQVPLMENGYCSKDDYSFIAEQMKYQFVPKGHYAVRQGEFGNNMFFIIKGSADVTMFGPTSEQVYLDSKAMYNDIAVQYARTKKSVRLANEGKDITN